MSKKPWRVQTRGDHFVVLGSNGDEIATSKEYSSASAANQAAQTFYESDYTTEVREKHFVVKGPSGNVVLTSKQYASKASATKSAGRFDEAMTGEWQFEKGVNKEDMPKQKSVPERRPAESPSTPAPAGDIHPPIPGVERHPQSDVYLK